MARISRSELTKLEIIQVATKKFLEDGYTDTSVKTICNELNMSTGNLTFYFPTKEHLLACLVELLCDFQQKMVGMETEEGYSSVMAICLELAAMAVMCEEDQSAKDFFLSAYRSPLSLEIIRKSDATRAKEVFKEYCSDWPDERFVEAEILVSGIEYATMMTAGEDVPLEVRISNAVESVLGIYGVPPDIRKTKVEKLLALDYRKVGRSVLKRFKKYVEEANEQAFLDLVKVN